MCSPAAEALNHELGTVMWECGQALLREQGLRQLKAPDPRAGVRSGHLHSWGRLCRCCGSASIPKSWMLVMWSHALVMQQALVEKSDDFPKASQEEEPTWARR